MYAVATMGVWLFVASRTIIVVHDQTIFESPAWEDSEMVQFGRHESDLSSHVPEKSTAQNAIRQE